MFTLAVLCASVGAAVVWWMWRRQLRHPWQAALGLTLALVYGGVALRWHHDHDAILSALWLVAGVLGLRHRHDLPSR